MLSRCITGDRRTPADVNVLGVYDISRAHFQSKARRTIVIRVPREDDECKSRYAVLDRAVYGTKDAPWCFDVARGNSMTVVGLPQVRFRFAFRYGDVFVVSGTIPQHKVFKKPETRPIRVLAK